MRNPNISRWLNNEIDAHEGEADSHESFAEWLRAARERWLKTGTLPRDVRREYQTRKVDQGSGVLT